MKWFYSIISILMTPVLLIAIYGIFSEHNTENLETLYWENEEEFCEVADELIRITRRNETPIGTYISTESTADMRLAEQKDDLYFYTTLYSYPKTDYADMYASVVDLISSQDLVCVAVDPGRVDFCVAQTYFGSFHLFYVADGAPFKTDMMMIKEKTKICDGWYAVVTYN